MAKVIFILMLSLLLSNTIVYANVPVVVLNSGDYSSYKELNTGEILDQLIIDRLIEIEGISIYEREVTKDSLEVEGTLTGDTKIVDTAVDTNDFNTIFNVAQNDISFKKVGDFLPSSQTKLLRERYGAEYIIYGSIDFIGGNERDRNVEWDSFKLNHSSKSITIFVSLRIIETQTGKIKWHHRVKGKVKDRFDSLNNFSYGTREFSNSLFMEALDEVGERLIRKLNKDLKTGSLVLQM